MSLTYSFCKRSNLNWGWQNAAAAAPSLLLLSVDECLKLGICVENEGLMRIQREGQIRGDRIWLPWMGAMLGSKIGDGGLLVVPREGV